MKSHVHQVHKKILLSFLIVTLSMSLAGCETTPSPFKVNYHPDDYGDFSEYIYQDLPFLFGPISERLSDTAWVLIYFEENGVKDYSSANGQFIYFDSFWKMYGNDGCNFLYGVYKATTFGGFETFLLNTLIGCVITDPDGTVRMLGTDEKFDILLDYAKSYNLDDYELRLNISKDRKLVFRKLEVIKE